MIIPSTRSCTIHTSYYSSCSLSLCRFLLLEIILMVFHECKQIVLLFFLLLLHPLQSRLTPVPILDAHGRENHSLMHTALSAFSPTILGTASYFLLSAKIIGWGGQDTMRYTIVRVRLETLRLMRAVTNTMRVIRNTDKHSSYRVHQQIANTEGTV